MLQLLAIVIVSIAVASSEAASYKFSLRESEGLYYIQDFFLGTPPQELHQILIDTGSSDLIVLQSGFNYRESSSFINTTNEFTGLYGSIGLFGMVQAFEVVTSPNGLVLQNETFGLADADVVPAEFNGENGILGLAYTRTEFIRPTYNHFTYLLKDEGKIDRVLFAINGQSSDPSIVFGGIHAGIYEEPLTRVPLLPRPGTTTDFYVPMITVDEIKLGDIVISNQISAFSVDTGADVFVPPTPVLANLFTAIGADRFDDDDEGYTYFNIDDFKDKVLTLDVQGLEFTIELNDLIQDEKVVNGTTYVAIPQYSVDIGINADAGTLPGFLLKEWYMVWDYDNHQMYFARYMPSGEQVESIVNVASGYELPVGTKDAPDPTNTYTAAYQANLETTITETNAETSSALGSSVETSGSDSATTLSDTSSSFETSDIESSAGSSSSSDAQSTTVSESSLETSLIEHEALGTTFSYESSTTEVYHTEITVTEYAQVCRSV
ncbi:SAP30 [Candida theae]|uniref:SAP30 n=1 Tax=Candida theae TaxID=1198502 RepID=A0AAD5FY05_9ASCO|nr:SAP30 [Candida theae]KAI5957487.1 SAP30 [Candida theae]